MSLFESTNYSLFHDEIEMYPEIFLKDFPTPDSFYRQVQRVKPDGPAGGIIIYNILTQKQTLIDRQHLSVETTVNLPPVKSKIDRVSVLTDHAKLLYYSVLEDILSRKYLFSQITTVLRPRMHDEQVTLVMRYEAASKPDDPNLDVLMDYATEVLRSKGAEPMLPVVQAWYLKYFDGSYTPLREIEARLSYVDLNKMESDYHCFCFICWLRGIVTGGLK